MVMWATSSKLYTITICYSVCLSDDRSQTILPLVKSFCEKSFKADESILISLSFHLGKLCHGLYGMFYRAATLVVFSFAPTPFV